MHQPSANHAPGASVTQVIHSVHTLSTFLRIIIIIIIIIIITYTYNKLLKVPKESSPESLKGQKPPQQSSCFQQSHFLDHFKSDDNIKLSHIYFSNMSDTAPIGFLWDCFDTAPNYYYCNYYYHEAPNYYCYIYYYYCCYY